MGLTLAQLAPPGGRNPLASAPRLPDAPLLERWLYEAPWTPAVALTLLGLLAAWLLLRAGQAGAQGRWAVLAACTGALAGTGLVLLASSVTTMREVLVERTRGLVVAVLAGDAATVERELSPSFALTLLGRQSSRGRDYVVSAVRGDIAARFNAKASELRWVRASMDGPAVARTQVSLLASSELMGGPTPTVWMIHWRADAQGRWYVGRLEAQEIGLLTGVPDP